MKTCRWRGGPWWERFVLCDGCWLPVKDDVWIVPGRFGITAKCAGCGCYGSIAEFSNLSPGQPQRGLCGECGG